MSATTFAAVAAEHVGPRGKRAAPGLDLRRRLERARRAGVVMPPPELYEVHCPNGRAAGAAVGRVVAVYNPPDHRWEVRGHPRLLTHRGRCPIDPREKESLERRRFQVARAGAVPAGFAFRRLPDLWRHLAAY